MKRQTLSIVSSITLGPLDENEAMNGAGFTPNSVLTRVMKAIGVLKPADCVLETTLEKRSNDSKELKREKKFRVVLGRFDVIKD